MFLFKPAVWRNGVLQALPRPVHSIRIHDSWSFEKLKVPLKNGDIFTGHSRQGVDIALEGQVGDVNGTLQPTEEAMFVALESLRETLSVDQAKAPYEFFLYHDVGTKTFRSFRHCTTVRFDYDLSSPHLFTYQVVIHAADPKIYAVEPV